MNKIKELLNKELPINRAQLNKIEAPIIACVLVAIAFYMFY